jgi:hypothetical protein
LWPHERSLVKVLQDKPFALIGVNINGYDANKLKEVMDKERLTWRSFVDRGAIADTWKPPGTPTLYILDHKGVIRHKWVGSPGEKVIDVALEKLIKEAIGTGKNLPK